jgi:hypothetical protein
MATEEVTTRCCLRIQQPNDPRTTNEHKRTNDVVSPRLDSLVVREYAEDNRFAIGWIGEAQPRPPKALAIPCLLPFACAWTAAVAFDSATSNQHYVLSGRPPASDHIPKHNRTRLDEALA